VTSPLRALVLDDTPVELLRACQAAGLEVVQAASPGEALRRLGREAFALVDGRLAKPRPLDEELQVRVDAFFERLGGHAASGLYEAVMQHVERPLLTGALARSGGVRGAAAATLGIDRGTLARRLRALGLDET
jgi:Fis family transcriptional regulator, factor for inversion stimulation protein